MASLKDLVNQYNEKATEQNLPTRKRFSGYKDAQTALEKLGIQIEIPEPKPKAERSASSSKGTTKMAKKAKTTKKVAKKSSNGNVRRGAPKGSTRFTDVEDKVFAEFAIIKDSQQHKALKRLLANKGKPVSLTDLTKATGTSRSATQATLRGLFRKISEMPTKKSAAHPKLYKLEKQDGDGGLELVLSVK